MRKFAALPVVLRSKVNVENAPKLTSWKKCDRFYTVHGCYDDDKSLVTNVSKQNTDFLR